MKKEIFSLCIILTGILMCNSFAQAGTLSRYVSNVEVDADDTDWSGIESIVDNNNDIDGISADPYGDGYDAEGNDDWGEVNVANNNAYLFLIGSVFGEVLPCAGYEYAVYIDVDNFSTGYWGPLGTWMMAANYKAYIDSEHNSGEEGGCLAEYIDESNPYQYNFYPLWGNSSSFLSAENGNAWEMAINLSALGVGAGDEIGLMWRAQDLGESWAKRDTLPHFTRLTYQIAAAPHSSPEPETIILFGTGVLGFMVFCGKKKKASFKNEENIQ